MNKSLVSLVMLASLATAPALAASANAPMSVRATIIPVCALTNVGTLPFSTFTNLDTNVTARTEIILDCAERVPYSIEVGAGQNSLDGQRRMSSNYADYLTYNLYTDAARTKPITTSNGPHFRGTSYFGKNIIFIYGQIPTGSLPAPKSGIYHDAVDITVIF